MRKRQNRLRSIGWLVVSLSMVGAASVRAGDWPMWRHDAHRSGVSPDGLPGHLAPLWVLELDTPRPAWPESQDKLQFDRSYEPVVAGGLMFVPSMVADHVTAYDTKTGERRWRYYTDGPVRFAPVAHAGRLYFVSDDGYLYCLDAAAGKLVWKHRGGPSDRKVLGNDRLVSAWPARGAPVIRDNTVYFAASIWPFMGIFLHAVDAESGDTVWTNSGSGSVYILQQHHSPAFAGVAPQGYLVATDDALIVSGGRTVPAVHDRRTGAFRYYRPEDRNFGKDAGGYGVCAGGEWYFNRGVMYETDDGDGVLSVPFPIIDGDTVYFIDRGSLHCRDLRLEREEYTDRKGEKAERVVMPGRWQVKLEPGLARVCLKAGQRLYGHGSDGLVAAIDLKRDEEAPAGISWTSRVSGDVWNMIAADDQLFVITMDGQIHCFAEDADQVVMHRSGRPDAAMAADTGGRARRILERAGAREGYALILPGEDSAFVRALIEASGLHVIVLDPDADRVEDLRVVLGDGHYYGIRAAALRGGIGSMELPPYWVDLAVCPSDGISDGDVRRIYEVLRPYGGVACFAADGDRKSSLSERLRGLDLPGAKVEVRGDDVLLARAGELPGSADWTHQYADAANSVVSRDRLPKAPLGLLWFGGPPNDEVLPRHGHGPTPQVAAGRLFIQGADMLRAVDVYTGRLLWQRKLPSVGKYYDYTSHEPGANAIGSNYVSLEDAVYVAYGDKCLVLDPATGETVRELTIPSEHGMPAPEWGYISVWEDLLVAGARPMSFWDPDFEPGEFEKADGGRIGSIKDAIRGWRDFDVRTAGDDKAFCIENLNTLLAEPSLQTKLPVDVLSHEGRGAAWRKKLAELRRELADWRSRGSRDAAELRRINRQLLQHYYPLPEKHPPTPGKFNLERTASSRIVVLDRSSGDVKWHRDARYAFRHNAIAVGGGNVFAIDRLPDEVIDQMQRRGQSPPEDAALVALDARSGVERWSKDDEVYGTWLGYSFKHDVLVQAGSGGPDRLRDEVKNRMTAYRGPSGDRIWHLESEYGGPVMLHHDTVITQGKAFDLLSGTEKTRRHPLTGREIPWRYHREYGCGTAVGSEHLLTFRSAAAGFYDLAGDGGTGNLGGFKSGCTSNLIPANGVLNAPDYTRTCTCSYQNQASLAFIHDPEAEMWTFTAIKTDDAPVLQVGLNLGAPGDRFAEDGSLWLDYPSVGGPSPDVPVEVEPEDVTWYRYHASRISSGTHRWVACSGARGLDRITVTLGPEGTPSRSCTVRLFFAEIDGIEQGRRVFDVSVQGRKVLSGFDILSAAGAAGATVMREWRDVAVADKLTIELRPSPGAALPETLLSGIEIIADDAKRLVGIERRADAE